MSTKTLPQNRKAQNGHYIKPTASLVTITPDLAATWLGKNTHNRNYRNERADCYAADMKSGNWQVTGEAIKFDEDGNLLDGQHRLSAIVKAGVAVPMFVIKGLARESQDAMDSGAKRTAGDMLGLHGISYPNHVASATRMAINWREGAFSSAHQRFQRAVTHAEVKTFVEANPDIATMAGIANRSWYDIPASMTTVIFAAWVLHGIDAREATKFFDDLAEKNLGGRGDPKVALLRRLQHARDNGEKLSNITQASLIFRAWNAVRSGSELNKFSPKAVATFTEPK